MDIFSKNKFLLRIVIILIVLNIFSIGYLWSVRMENYDNRPPKKSIREITGILQNRLHLSNEQLDQLQLLREEFFRKEELLSAVIRSQRDSMNVEMFNETTDTVFTKSIARRLADNEYLMGLYKINQSQKLKTICNKDQLKEFNKLVKDIRDYFEPERKNKN